MRVLTQCLVINPLTLATDGYGWLGGASELEGSLWDWGLPCVLSRSPTTALSCVSGDLGEV